MLRDVAQLTLEVKFTDAAAVLWSSKAGNAFFMLLKKLFPQWDGSLPQCWVLGLAWGSVPSRTSPRRDTNARPLP